MKLCPYCTKILPFFNTVFQRLTFSKDKPLVCGNCGSVISMQGGASIWISLVLGSASGGLLGKLLGNLSYSTLALTLLVGVVLFVLSSYFTAPVRES